MKFRATPSGLPHSNGNPPGIALDLSIASDLNAVYHGGMLWQDLHLAGPGLFITGTDTAVGKTVVTCAIARLLRDEMRIGVAKPMATGCRREREGLVSADAEALAYFADCREPLDVINPVRFVEPVAPAVAAEREKRDVDFDAMARCLSRLDQVSDGLLIEGIGGVMVPVAPASSIGGSADDMLTILDVIAAIGYPVVVVTRASLGTLNHTAMTVQLLRAHGCRVAGLVVSGYRIDDDPAMASNPQWLARLTGVNVLATLPQCEADDVSLDDKRIPDAIFDAIAMCHWPSVMAESCSP